LSEYALSVLRSYQRFRFHAVAGIGGALFLLGGSVALSLGGRVTLVNVIALVLFWTPLVKLALGLVRVPGSVLALGRPDGTRMRRLLGFGRWVWGTQLLESGVKRVNILLLQAFAGNVATGYFHMGSRYVEFLSLVFQPLRKYLLPKLTALETLEQMGAALRRTYAGLAFTLLLIPAAWIAGGPVITWAQGSEWLPAVELFRILVVARLLVLLAKPMSFVLFSLDRPRSQMLAHAVGALAYLVCAAALIPSLGARGGAYSILVFSVAVFLALAWTLSREWKRARSAGPAAADASSADSFYLDP
jgi:O-antigen/teichoic acid export membrane protein